MTNIWLTLLMACGEQEDKETNTTNTQDSTADASDTDTDSTNTTDSTTDTATDTDTTTGTDTNTDTAPDFLGQSFILQGSEGYEPVGTNILLDFPEAQASPYQMNFDAGCNSIGGSFTITNDALQFEELYATEMGCDTDLMNQDDWFIQFFMNGPTVAYDGSSLTLSNDDVVLTFQAEDMVNPDQNIQAGIWEFDTFIDGALATTYNLERYPTAEFKSSGELAIFTGCNDGIGTYTQSGDELSFSVSQYTEMWCEGDINVVESYITSIFMFSATVSIDGNSITLTSDDKAISGSLQAAE